MRYPNKVMELIKLLPEGHSDLQSLIKSNYKRINLDKLKILDSTNDLIEIKNIYLQIIEEILDSNPKAFELLKNLSVINTDLETNIDKMSVYSSYKVPNIEIAFNELVNTKILKKKEEKEEIYTFLSPQVQNILRDLTDDTAHEGVLQYYEKKMKHFGVEILDDIEVLYHKAKLNPNEELVNEFLAIANNIEQFEFKHKRMIDVAEELFVLEDKYKAPILVVLGNVLSVLGNPETAEEIYLNALDLYRDLAKQYYKIFLPYVAATQKNLGTLYLDLKRFEDAEKIYSDALSSYNELAKQFYGAHSPDFHSEEYSNQEKSYIDDLKAYNELLKESLDIFLPDEPSITSEYGHVGIDVDLLEDLQDGSIDSIDSYKTLAKMSYDMYLFDIAKTLSNLGIVYIELMKFEEAERTHLKALKIKRKIADHFPSLVLPELVLTLLDLGDLYATLNKFEKAEPMFNEALKISKELVEENPEVYLYNVAIIQKSLGTIYSRLKKFELAEEKYLEALKIFKNYANKDPKTYSYNVADVQNNLADIFLNTKNLEKAEHYLNKAFKKDPSNGEIIYNIACLESLKNNKAKALEQLKKVIEIDESYIERASQDNRLKNIWNLPEFKELIGD